MHDFVFDKRAHLLTYITVYLKFSTGSYSIAGKRGIMGLLPKISGYLNLTEGIEYSCYEIGVEKTAHLGSR